MPFKNTDGSPIESIHQLGDFHDDCRETSIPFDDGGDTHIHAGSEDRAVITTRLGGHYEEHFEVSASEDDDASQDFDPSEAAGAAFREVMGNDSSSDSSDSDFNPSEDAGAAFRSVMGDDN